MAQEVHFFLVKKTLKLLFGVLGLDTAKKHTIMLFMLLNPMGKQQHAVQIDASEVQVRKYLELIMPKEIASN